MSMGSEPPEEEIFNLRKELEQAKEKHAKAIEDGCPTKKDSGKPCYACQQSAARVRACA